MNTPSKPINRVTVTGADDSVDPRELIKLSERYPFVEWGLLLSRNNTDHAIGPIPRFPSSGWLDRLGNLLDWEPQIQVSGHICGSWVRNIYLGKLADFSHWRESMGQFASRWQLNTHGIKHELDEQGLLANVKSLTKHGEQVIFQLDRVNNQAMRLCLGKANVAGLHDLSHGAGKTPMTWSAPIWGLYNGYAGGLSPGNVVEEVERILPVLPENMMIWIDAETHLRSDGDTRFDLAKVEAFLQAAQPYVTDDVAARRLGTRCQNV